ncbi:MAG TPA: enoyl-CoA hydratase/isomerase family protein [Pyrinomonadaceae bacterium]|nr:enoyl-CoA hydratase/isomerase family protein [Pyrinomonadaceae bacterium]
MSLTDESAAIILEEVGPIAIVRFSKPRQRNPLSLRVLNELDELVSNLQTREHLQAIIFTGTDNAFLSGADIRELRSLTATAALDFSRRGQQLMQKISEARQVVIAAINGYCMGGGLDFALACHIRVGSSQAVFSHPGARLGIITGWGGTQRLPRLIGKNHALEMFVSAKQLTSDEALRLGLITGIYDPVLATAIRLAQELPLRNDSSLSGY